MRVVLDANQFISGVLVSRGNPAKILDAWRDGRFELLLSEFALVEIRRVLHYPKIRKRHSWSASQIDDFVERLRDSATMVDVRTRVDAVTDDPDDNAYLALAVDGDAHCVVSGDQHLLKLREYQGIRIVTAAAFLRDLARAGEPPPSGM
ncbi:MAG: putative toxin-antitoxin system toxin component, PIN family [Planctomycetes bacterium]|nr:putative toxin-antitoxin system toxin component, PIN family [Planctomycetota bacterium]